MLMRQLASIALIVVGGIALVGGFLTRYADRNLLDPERFAEHAVEVLDDEGAQDEIGDVIVNELEKQGVDRADSRKAVGPSMAEVAEDERFRDALLGGLQAANEQTLGEEQDDVQVVIEDVGTPLAKILRERDPQIARLIERSL
ncbi:MAG: hypothetical protein M3355_08280, partial [Actinomycetota bacterium]|nr:hypothetical protein [Actinomycetota bacterium]